MAHVKNYEAVKICESYAEKSLYSLQPFLQALVSVTSAKLQLPLFTTLVISGPLRQSETLASFKRQLKTFLFSY